MKYLNYDRVSEVYDETRNIPKELKIFFKNEIHEFLIRKNNSPPYNLLSIGIGTGRLESLLSSNISQLFGIDIAKEMIKKLIDKKLNPPCYLTLADGYVLPFRKTFHIISLIHFLHFIDDFDRFFNEISRVSKLLVIGNAYTDAHLHPHYTKFREILVQNGWKECRNDVPTTIKFHDFMEQKGYNVIIKEKHMPTRISKNSIYESIKNRYFSSFWDIDHNLFSTSLAKFDLLIKENREKTENYFHTNSTVRLIFYDLN